MKILGVCAVALCATALMLLIKQFRSEMSLPLTVCITLAILGSVYLSLTALLDWTFELWENSAYSIYCQLMMKALGISLVGSLAAGICRDAGENSVANAVEFAAKCEILLLSLPLLQELLTFALSLESYGTGS